ncbi:MAG: hypothetical protein RJQ14_12785 [Marinoscillum sp.]
MDKRSLLEGLAGDETQNLKKEAFIMIKSIGGFSDNTDPGFDYIICGSNTP